MQHPVQTSNSKCYNIDIIKWGIQCTIDLVFDLYCLTTVGWGNLATSKACQTSIPMSLFLFMVLLLLLTLS